MTIMKKLKIRIRRNILLTALFTTILFSLSSFLFPLTSFAQCQNDIQNQGLISTGDSINPLVKFGNSDSVCITGNEALYRGFKVPSYQDMEDQFYTFNRFLAKKSDLPQGSLAFSGDGLYLHKDNLTINPSYSPTGSGAQVIFIRGDLNITGDIDYAKDGEATADSSSGLVFVVSGNINIYSNVRKVNAVLISFGQICTAYLATSSTCANGTTDITEDLTINGSLISLNKTPNSGNIKFRRYLEDNLQPAEIINQQPKYLYILKGGLFSKDLIITTEDRHYQIP